MRLGKDLSEKITMPGHVTKGNNVDCKEMLLCIKNEHWKDNYVGKYENLTK